MTPADLRAEAEKVAQKLTGDMVIERRECHGMVYYPLEKHRGAITDALLAFAEKHAQRYGARKLLEGSDEQILRELVWYGHGCSGAALYGDDGEMQCAECRIDFKRDSVTEIQQRLQARNLQRGAALAALERDKEAGT